MKNLVKYIFFYLDISITKKALRQPRYIKTCQFIINKIAKALVSLDYCLAGDTYG
jgi:hypothetical protein